MTDGWQGGVFRRTILTSFWGLHLFFQIIESRILALRSEESPAATATSPPRVCTLVQRDFLRAFSFAPLLTRPAAPRQTTEVP